MDSVKVAVRIRPLLQKERQNGRICMWNAIEKTVHQRDESSPLYTFDCVYDENATTYEINDEISSPIVQAAMTGFHGTVFAYGQSGSGKTYSMSGDNMSPGLIALAIDEIFEYINQAPNKEFLLRVTYMEIYNEKISDLLSSEDKVIKIQENTDHQINVIGLIEQHVTCKEEVFSVVKQGDNRRRTAATAQNDRSSRSHSILRVIIESRETAEEDAVMVSHLNFVDLAGSEKAGDNTGKVFKEGCAINKSLFTLSQVISKLSEGDGEGYISYRDSKLTRILQNALGGNSKTAMICTISPTSIEESHSTLKFASRAKKIKNKPHLNEVFNGDAALLNKYRMEIQRLQQTASEMGVNDMLMEKDELERKLREKEEAQNEQQRLIENLQRMICVSSSIGNPDRKDVKKKLRRETWCGPKLRRQSHFPANRSILSAIDMDFSTFEMPESSSVRFRDHTTTDESDFTILSIDNSIAPQRRISEEADQEKEALKLQIKEMEIMIEKLSNQYYEKEEEFKELREFTVLEKSIMDKEVNEKVEGSIKEMGEKLNQRDLYINQVEAELYKLADEKSSLNKQLKEKNEELKSLQQKVVKTKRESEQKEKVNQDYITMLERQVEQTEAKLKNADNVRHSTGQFLVNKNKIVDDEEKTNLKEEINKLKSLLEEKNYEIDSLKMENIELEKQQNKAREYRMKLQELQDSVDNKNNLDDFESTELIISYKTKIEELEADLEFKNQALSNIDLETNNFTSQEVAEYQKKVATLESELSESQNQIQHKSDALTLIESEIIQYKSQIQSLENEVEQKNKALEAIDLENMDRSNSESQTRSLKIQIQTLEVTIQKLNQDNESLKEEHSRVEADLEFKNQALSNIDLETNNFTSQEVSEYQKKVATLESELSESQNQIQHKSDALTLIESEIIQYKSQIQSLENEVEQKNKALEAIDLENMDRSNSESQTRSLKIQIQTLEVTIQKLNQDNESLKEEHSRVEADLEFKNQALSNIDLETNNFTSQEVSEYQKKVATLESELSESQNQIQHKSDALTLIESEIIQYKSQIQSLENEVEQKNKALEAIDLENMDRSNSESQTRSLKIQIQTLEVTIQKLNQDNENLKEEHSRVEAELSANMAALQEKVTDKNKENKQVSQEIVSKSEQDTQTEASEEVESLKDNIDELKTELLKLQVENKEKAKQNDNTEEMVAIKANEIENLNQQLEELKKNNSENISVYESHIESQKSEIQMLKSQLEELTSCEKCEVEIQCDTVDDKTGGTSRLEEEIFALQHERKDLRDLIEEQKVEMEDLREQLNTSSEQHTELKEEINSLEENIAASNETIEMLNEKIVELESELADLRPKCERVGELFSRVQELQTELDLKETEMKKLVTSLEMASQRDESLKNLNQKIAALEAEAEKKDEVIHSSKHYSDQVTQLNGENMVLKEKLTTIEAELLSKTEELAETQPRLAELQKELENLQNEVGDLQDIIERETDENTENKEKITNLQREVSDRRDQIEDLEGQVKQLSLTKKSLEHDYERLHTDHADMLSWYQKQQEEDILKAEGKDTESILKEQLSELRQEFSAKREAIVTMEMEFRDTLAGKDEELSNLQLKVETLTTDLEAFDKTKKELADMTNEKCELEQDIKDNIEQIAILQVDLEEKTEAIKSLKRENEALCQDSEESKEQITKLQIDVADGLETITELKNRESELEAKVLELQHDLSIKSEEVTRLNEGKASESHFQEQILKLQNHGSELEEQIVALEEELSTKSEELSTKSEELSTKSEELSTKSEELFTKSEEIKNLRQEKISESELQAQITKLQTELSNGFETITELKNKEEASHGEIKTLQEDLLKKTEIISTLQAEVATDNEQITRLRKDLLESVNTVDRLKQERQSNVTDAEQTDNGGRIQQLLDEKKELEEENRKKMEEQETEWKKTVRDLKLDRFSLRSQLSDAKKEIARLGRGFDAFDIKIAEIEKENEELMKEKNALEETFKQKQEKWAGLEESNAAMYREIYQLKYSHNKETIEFEKKEAGLIDTVQYKDSVINRLKDQLRRQGEDLDTTTCEPVKPTRPVEQVLVDVGTASGVIDKYTVCMIEAENKYLQEDKDKLKKEVDEYRTENENLQAKIRKLKQEKKEIIRIQDSEKENINSESMNMKKRKVSEETDDETEGPFSLTMDMFTKTTNNPHHLLFRNDMTPGKSSPSKDVSNCKSQ
ncbi:uncharacterized protein LOC126808622 [Patella vulgata]|uniref:uncharacterized protein LOC126808622 n=1 Tax=Patella vulgata TaxID=6465 RepID=UPI0024A904C6|nr:uncharacterized protein LOC126808622 [Patella vulgata]